MNFSRILDVTIKLLFVITLGYPIVKCIDAQQSMLKTLIEVGKEFTIPIWLLFFSVSWIYYKFQVKELSFLKVSGPIRIEEFEKFRHISGNEETNQDIARIQARMKKLHYAESSLENLEIVIAIASAIIGLLGFINYLFF